MSRLYAFIQKNADRLFAGFCLVGSALITMSGNYTDNNGDADNVLLTVSGIVEIVAQVYQLVRGQKSKPISAPLYILGGFALFASGIGFLGLSYGSVEEAITGILMAAGASSIFYGDRIFYRTRFTGPFIGGWLYNISCIPLLIAGIHHQNPFEAGAAVAFFLGNTVMACKPKAR